MARLKPPRKLGGADRFKYQPGQPNDANDGTDRTWPSFFSANPAHGGLPIKAIPTIFRTASDTLTITDEASPGKESYDTLTLTDVATRTGTFIRTTSDSLGLSDAVSSRPSAIPTFVGAGTYAHTTVGTLTPGLPAGWQINDIFIITHFSNSTGAAPTGYTQAGSRTGKLQVYWKRATSSESDPVIAAAGNACARMVAFRGCATSGDPFEALNAAASGGASTTFKSGGLTTLGDSRLYWISIGRTGDNSSSQYSAWQAFSTEDVTEAIDDGFQDGLGGGTAGAYGGASHARAYGPFLANVGISVDTDYIEFALIPGPILRTASDSLSLSDAVTRTLTNLRDITDSLGLSDSAVASKVIARTVSDSLGVTDATTRTGTFVRTTSDSLGITDAATRQFSGARTTSDSLGLSDSAVAETGVLHRTSSDSLTMSDAATRLLQLHRSTSDGLTITDAAVAVVMGAGSGQRSFYILIG